MSPASLAPTLSQQLGQMFQPSSKLTQIQVMRAFAALAVCFGHILEEVQRMNSSPLVGMLLTVPWDFGVDVFFIISGFIMMYTSHSMFGRKHAFKDFMLRRLIRIVPPYWFFTSIIVIIAALLPNLLDSTTFTFSHAALSYLFIPHIEPGEHAMRLHPILGLGWTLVYEMFFYLMFAFALMFRQRTGLILLLLVFLGLFVSAQQGIWTTALNLFWGKSIMLEFLLGVLAGLYARQNAHQRKAFLAIMGLAVIGSVLSYIFPQLSAERFFHLGMPALLLFCILYQMQIPANTFWLGVVLIGDASYTLYLSHPFALTATKLALKPLLEIGAYHPALIASYVMLALTASILGAFVFYALCEKPVTNYLQRLHGNHRSA